MNPARSTLDDLFASSFARYLSVHPTGLRFPHGRLCSSVEATVHRCRPARTLYRKKQPVCRSLDGIISIKEENDCASCVDRKDCTAQIYLELTIDAVPYRLLLAYTSARNFMQFASRIGKQGLDLKNTRILIAVRDRGRWGELCFIAKPPEQGAPRS